VAGRITRDCLFEMVYVILGWSLILY
jgi:hypothetical protein